MKNEKSMFPKIKAHFNNEFSLFREVPFYNKRIDVVGVNRSTSELIAIELKLEDWKKALQQAAMDQLGGNRAYVALWHKNIHRADIEKFKECGIGLLEVNDYLKEVVKAAPSYCFSYKMADLIRRNLRGRIHIWRGVLK